MLKICFLLVAFLVVFFVVASLFSCWRQRPKTKEKNHTIRETMDLQNA